MGVSETPAAPLRLTGGAGTVAGSEGEDLSPEAKVRLLADNGVSATEVIAKVLEMDELAVQRALDAPQEDQVGG